MKWWCDWRLGSGSYKLCFCRWCGCRLFSHKLVSSGMVTVDSVRSSWLTRCLDVYYWDVQILNVYCTYLSQKMGFKRKESIARTSKSFMNGLARTGDKIELNRSSVLETGSLTSGNSILNTVVNFLMNPCDREYLRLWHTSFKSEVIVSYLVWKNLYLLNVFCERWTEYAEWVDIEGLYNWAFVDLAEELPGNYKLLELVATII